MHILMGVQHCRLDRVGDLAGPKHPKNPSELSVFLPRVYRSLTVRPSTKNTIHLKLLSCDRGLFCQCWSDQAPQALFIGTLRFATKGASISVGLTKAPGSNQ